MVTYNSSKTKRNKTNKFLIIISFISCILLIIGCGFILLSTNLISLVFSVGMPMLVLANLFLFVYWLIKKKVYLFFSLSSILIYFLCFDSFLQFSNMDSDSQKESFTFLSYNVRDFNLDGNINKIGINQEIVSFVKDRDPDIVSFQEFSHHEFKSFSYYPYKFIGYREGKAKSMQVIYSKFPIVNKGFIDFENTRNGGIYIDFKYNDEIIRLYNLHLQSFGGEMDSKKEHNYRYFGSLNKISSTIKLQNEQTNIVLNHSKSFNGKVIICGDFNSTQFSSTYNILKKGRKDSFIEKGYGLGTTYSLFNYPLRLDFILPDDTFEIISHENFKLGLSDHEPILVELAVK